jgi:hypothetical protein
LAASNPQASDIPEIVDIAVSQNKSMATSMIAALLAALRSVLAQFGGVPALNHIKLMYSNSLLLSIASCLDNHDISDW